MEAKQKKQMDLLTAIEQIVEKAKDSKLSPEFYRKASRYIKYVSDKLDLTKEQSVMLALFINLSDDDSIRLYQLSNYVQCPTIRILRYKNEINELEKRELIRCYRNARGCCKSISYRVPFDVIDALNRNEKFTPRNCTGLTCQELFGELEDIFELRGAPGTGKTETVLQLARQTGRDILQVDVSKIKSCWVGESEKNIKNLFDTYRDKVKKSEKAPILLFNEADAIINKRQEGAERAVDKMENSIQNIILQEMEDLNGIMIATTNLAQNMDKAFERRFLYKIKFEKPTLEARMHIWQEMIPTLSEDDTMTLAEKYEFSGGQIENIARHNAINGILYGEKANSLEALMSYCDNERLETKQTRKIGF